MTELTHGLREIVWGIESEVAQIGGLARRIDAHVTAVSTARRELAERLVRLDVLVAAAQDPALERFLRTRARVSLPRLTERFPDRLYPGDD